MGAIYRREIKAYFNSPVAYIFIAVFCAYSGLMFYIGNVIMQDADLNMAFSSIFNIIMILLPILTMRLFSEEKRQKTEQGLLTAPVSLFEIVLGKFFAAMTIFATAIAIYLVYALALAALSADVSWIMVLGNIVGLLLLGSSFIAAGIFVSAMTENQIVAAVGSFVVIMLLYMIDVIAQYVTVPFISKLLLYLSFYSRYYEITSGVFNITSMLFFVSITAVFLFLTVRVFEKRRWS